MGQLAGRNTGQQNQQLAGTSQTLFMDPCADCGAPVSVVARVKPDPMRCTSCAAKAAASAAAGVDTTDD